MGYERRAFFSWKTKDSSHPGLYVVVESEVLNAIIYLATVVRRWCFGWMDGCMIVSKFLFVVVGGEIPLMSIGPDLP